MTRRDLSNGAIVTASGCRHMALTPSKVLETRVIVGAIRRRRECVKCGGHFTTYEEIVGYPPGEKLAPPKRLDMEDGVSAHVKMNAADRKIYRAAQSKAQKLVRQAVLSGKLPNLRQTEIMCVDCKIRRAAHYEHRDYRFPLAVEPVCQRCNISRGPALLTLAKNITPSEVVERAPQS